jgi:hypothetical protein
MDIPAYSPSDRSRIDLTVFDAHVWRESEMTGTPPLHIEVVLCDINGGKALIKDAIIQLLKSRNFEVLAPGWNEVDFLFAQKRSYAEVISQPPKRWETTKLVLKLDILKDTDGPKPVVTPLYEIESGPRDSDRDGWKPSDDEAFQYMDRLRWQILNIVQSSLESDCKRIYLTGPNPTKSAVKMVSSAQAKQIEEKVHGQQKRDRPTFR